MGALLHLWLSAHLQGLMGLAGTTVVESFQVIKRRSKPRRVSVTRNRKYLAFLRSDGVCDPCGYPWESSGTDPAHGPVNGMGSKGSDLEAVPLCRTHHQEQHAIGWKAFCAKYKLDRKELVAYWNRAYLQSGLTAIKEPTESATSRV